MKKTLLIFFLISVLPSLALATNYYVRKDGNDSNDGLTNNAAGAWLTISKATSTVPAGNHTVTVNEGTYAENVTEATSGTDPGYLYYVASGTVQINGTVTLSGDWIKFEGFTATRSGTYDYNEGVFESKGDNNYFLSCNATNSNFPGFFLFESTDSGTVDSCTTSIVADAGIQIRGTNHLIVNNDISRMQQNGSSDCNGMWLYGSGHTIRGNYIHDFRWPDETGATTHIDGIQSWHNPSFPTIQNAGQNIVVEKNHIFIGLDSTGVLIPKVDAEGPHVLMIGGHSTRNATNWTVRNNIFEAHSMLNEGEYQREGDITVLTNLYFYNNTFIGELDYTTGGPNGLSLDNVTGLEIFNNIFVDFYLAHINLTADSSFTAGYNLFWNSDGSAVTLDPSNHYTAQTGDKVSNGTDYDPLFDNWNYGVAAGYKLASSASPAYDAATATKAPSDDYDGESRPLGSSDDIGAYEYNLGTIQGISISMLVR